MGIHFCSSFHVYPIMDNLSFIQLWITYPWDPRQTDLCKCQFPIVGFFHFLWPTPTPNFGPFLSFIIHSVINKKLPVWMLNNSEFCADFSGMGVDSSHPPVVLGKRSSSQSGTPHVVSTPPESHLGLTHPTCTI